MRYNLSEISAVIRDRRSIPPEMFSSREIHKEIIEGLLKNAIWAPTHGNTQPWRFKVFTGDGKKRLSDSLLKIYRKDIPSEERSELKENRMRERPLKSSAIIVLCMARQESEKIPEIEEIEAVACAAQNIWLTATAYGLGAFGVLQRSSMESHLPPF